MNNKSTPTHGIADMVGDWEETTLGDCADWLSGGTPSKGNVEFWCGSIPWVSAKDMKSFHLYDAEDHISPLAIGNGGKVVPAGTIFCSGAWNDAASRCPDLHDPSRNGIQSGY
jgi:hypothetical protein